MLDTAAAQIWDKDPKETAAVSVETVLSVEHYTDRLFSFRLTRPASFRFRSGEFVMIGLQVNGKPLLRAYSIASPSWDEALEFYSIKVPDGPLTSRLLHIQPGDKVLLGRKPTGTLVLDALTPGKRLYFFSTGTGIAPFASLARDPDTYERYETVVLTHGCRLEAELAYGADLVARAKADPLVGEMAQKQLIYLPMTTRTTFPRMGRIPELMASGELYRDAGAPPLSPGEDRAMICGSMEMLRDVKAACEAAGLKEGSNAQPGEFVVERAFVG